MDTLGVDEKELAEAKLEIFEREEEVHRRKRKNSAGMDKKHSLKALDIIGFDPSEQKIRNTLGLQESDIDKIKQDKIEEYEEDCKRERRNSHPKKKESLKALKVLGLDPSKQKIAETLGMEAEQIREAELETIERTEELIKRSRQHDDRINKKNIIKALKVLGHDPSEAKLETHFGIEKSILQVERKDTIINNRNIPIPSTNNNTNNNNNHNPSYNPTNLLISSTGVLMASIVVYYAFFKTV
jgi:hypothetical protein